MLYYLTTAAVAVLAVLFSTTFALLAYAHFQRGARRLWDREQKLPDATRYHHLKNLVDDLQAEVDDLRDIRAESQQIIDEAERRREWMDQTKEEVEQLSQQMEEVEKVSRELETKQLELADCNQKLIDKQEELARANEVVKELEDRQAEVESLRTELTQKRQELANLEKDLETAQTDKRDLDGMIAELERTLERLDKDRVAVENQIKEAENRLQALTDRNVEAGKQRDSLEREASLLSSQVDALANRKDSLDNLVRQLEKLPGVEDTFTADVSHSSIWEPYLQQSGLRPGSDELAQLDNFRQYLNSNRLYYSERTIDAFHTSLKISESSPLIVLAGVSGTGKSMLPRYYAEALGLNFLNIAVQPRWDGPQDLFGFFDYIDRRFRTTPLTRALLQMDPIGPQADRGWNPPDEWSQYQLHDQMLLVLLDEMNLARVEYYFSEFLSKLEIRNGIRDSTDANERQMSEIELDIGGGQEGALSLFVDTNVLFVGTMNEDETTQVLSDKVIDRANVLRFGSPAHLKMDLSSPNGQPTNVQPEKLSLESWRDWKRAPKEIDAGDRERVENWIELLRGAMANARRPFAYRVANGIWEYIANYPRRPDFLRYAMSDQIEQKLLPKLRGLDSADQNTRDTFDTIGLVLDELNDQELLTEFDKCRDEQFFAWSGVDRREGIAEL
jgi:uncharacterized coiled-coil DUF342 family protein